MKNFLVAISVTLAFVSIAAAQQANTRADSSARKDTSVSKQGRQLNIQSGTQLTGKLENTIDVRHAKVGDHVIVKTTQAVKQNGEVMIPKGTRLLGHVTEVQRRTSSNGESRLGIVFDRLQNGSLMTPITATIVSITQARSNVRTADNGMDADIMTSSSARSTGSASPAQRSSSSGVLGGVTNAVGGVINTTTSTVGNVADRTTNAVGSTVGSTTNTVANTPGALRGWQITQSSNASAEGGSTLTLNSGNLRLESGATFTVLVSNSARVENP